MIVEVRITGRVQGVCFRAWTQDEALSLGLQGWVRNCPDASVEACFEGEDSLVEEMLRRCHEGPPLARVQNVAVTPLTQSLRSRGFEILS